MDASNLIAPLIGLAAPIVVSAIKWRASRIETRTALLDYWKTYFEVAPLAGQIVSDETKRLCIAELAEGEDEVRNLGNKLVSFITTASTVTVMYFFTFVFAVWSGFVERVRVAQYAQYEKQHPGVISLDQRQNTDEQLTYAILIFQVLIMCLIWFWARWKIRDYVWNQLRPGKFFHFLLNADERMEGLTKTVLTFVLVALASFLTAYIGTFLKLFFQSLNRI